MQAPICTNCSRRDEVCTYDGVLDTSSALTQWQDDYTKSLVYDNSKFASGVTQSVETYPGNRPSFASNMISTDVSIGTLLKVIMGRSWFSPIEAGVWSSAIMKNVTKHAYLQHSILSIAHLRRDLLDRPSTSTTSAAAYEHQMVASALFRQDTTVSPTMY